MKKIILLSALSLNLVVACGGGSGGGGTATELQGTWNTTCLYNSVWDVYETTRVTFSGNSFDTSGTDYLDSGCTTVDDTYATTGTFVIGQSLTTSSGLSAKEIDLTIQTIDGESFAFVFYDIYRIDGNKLFTGNTGGFDEDEHDGTTQEKRPIALLLDLPNTKI